jgi:hypothetical protein
MRRSLVRRDRVALKIEKDRRQHHRWQIDIEHVDEFGEHRAADGSAALRRFSCLSAASATKPEDRVAVIGGSPVILCAACGVVLFVRLASLLWIKQTPQSGNQLFRLALFPGDHTLLVS